MASSTFALGGGTAAPADSLSHNDVTRPFMLACFDSETRVWSMTEQANAILAKLAPEKRIRSVGIAGTMRQGKSYLMNRFADEQRGFELGPYVEGHTRGLWAWFPPKRNPHGCSEYLMLLDTEGLADPKRSDNTHDAQMMVLIALLSSVLLYNFLGAPNEEVLSKLAFASEMTQHVHVRMAAGASSASASAAARTPSAADFKSVFPRLVFVARDFFLRFPPDTPTKEDYFARLMAPRAPAPGASPDALRIALAANKTRAAVMDFFPNVELQTLIRPVDDDNDLLQLDAVPEERLRPRFLDAVNAFVNDVLSHAGVRLVRGGGYAQEAAASAMPLTSGVLQSFVTALLDAFTRGVVPDLMSVIDSTSKIVCNQAVEAAMAHAEEQSEEMVAGLPIAFNDMCARMQPVVDAAGRIYTSAAMGSAAEAGRVQLQQRLVLWSDTHNAANFDASTRKATHVYESVLARLRSDMDRGVITTYEAFSIAAERYETEAMAGAGELGPAVEKVIEAMQPQQRALNEYAMAQFRLKESERERVRQQQLAEEERQRHDAAQEQFRQESLRAQEQMRQMQSQMAQLAERSAEQAAAHVREMKDLQERNAKSMEAMRKEHMEAVAVQNKSHTDSMGQLTTNMQKQMKELSDKHASDMAAANQRIAQLQASRGGGGGGGGGRCFASSSLVTLADGTMRPVSELQPGDSILAVADNGSVYTDTVVFRVPREVCPVTVITLESGECVRVTPDHLLCVADSAEEGAMLKCVLSSAVAVGDRMARLVRQDATGEGGQLHHSTDLQRVVSVATAHEHVTTMLTHSGRVVASGLAASCHTGSETIGQVLAWPLRMLQRYGGAKAVHSWPVLTLFNWYEMYIGY